MWEVMIVLPMRGWVSKDMALDPGDIRGVLPQPGFGRTWSTIPMEYPTGNGIAAVAEGREPSPGMGGGSRSEILGLGGLRRRSWLKQQVLVPCKASEELWVLGHKDQSVWDPSKISGRDLQIDFISYQEQLLLSNLRGERDYKRLPVFKVGLGKPGRSWAERDRTGERSFTPKEI